jgi:uncharacterized protein (UPF0332 family)
MPFNPVDYYKLASWLYEQRENLEFGESPVRAVISKAYYGAFLAARNKAGITSKSPTVHQQVIDHYNQKNKSSLANRLESMRTKRNDADYDTVMTFSSRDAGLALAAAKKVLEDL